MTFRAAYVCIACDQKLTNKEVFYSGGVCSYCGYITNGTICKVKKIAIEEPKVPEMSILDVFKFWK